MLIEIETLFLPVIYHQFRAGVKRFEPHHATQETDRCPRLLPKLTVLNPFVIFANQTRTALFLTGPPHISISIVLTGVALAASFIPAGHAAQGRSDDRAEV
jgi:hypothetical protein